MSQFSDLKEKIIGKAEKDAGFRVELKEDPKGAIEKYFPQTDTKQIPQKINIVVCEDSENTIYLNIAPTEYHKGAY